MHGLLVCNINTGVHTRGADVSLRDVTIAQMGNGTTEWRHAPEARGGFWGFWKSQLSWPESYLGRWRLTFACSRRPWAGVARDGGRGKSQNRTNVYLISLCRITFNSKVIKSRKCFSCFEIPMFYVIYIYIYIWTCYVHFNIHVWLCNTFPSMSFMSRLS